MAKNYSTRREADFDYNTLRMLTEKFLSNEILQNTIIKFLEDNLKKGETPSVQFQKIIGKSQNTTYKSLNTTINIASFLRYWYGMLEIARNNNIDQSKIPKFEETIQRYKNYLDFMTSLNTEDNLEILIENYRDEIMKIVNFNNKESRLSALQKECIVQVKEILKKTKPASIEDSPRLAEQLERMKK